MGPRSLSAAILSLAALIALGAGAGAQELGARALGMGGAYVALSDDIASLVYNPAGLADTSFQVGIGLGSNDVRAVTRFVSLLEDSSSLSGEAALDVATLSGVSIAGFGAGFAAQGSIAATDSCGDPFELCAEGGYLSQIILAYGRRLTAFGLSPGRLQAGISVKRLDARSITYEKTKPAGDSYEVTVEDWRGQGYSLTLGARLLASEVFTVGIAAHDVVSSLAWTGERRRSRFVGETETSLPRENLGSRDERLDPVYRFSVAVRPPFLGVTLAGDLGTDGSVRYGVDKRLLSGALALRFGGIRAEGEAAATVGLGIHLGPVRLDAAAASADGFKTVTTMIEGSVRF